MSPGKNKNMLLFSVAIFLVLVLSFTGAYYYVSAERCLYWWDYSHYTDLVSFTAKLSPIQWLPVAWLTCSQDYSIYPVLPLIPIEVAFPKNRPVFIATLTSLYGTIYVLLLGAIVSGLVKADRLKAFWSTFLVAILCPFIWAQGLRSYPDTIAAIVIAMSWAVYLRDPDIKNGKTIFTIGLNGLVPILRRHFSYDSIYTMIAIGLDQLIEWYQKDRQQESPKKALSGRLIKLVMIAITAFLMLIVLGTPFPMYIMQGGWKVGLYDSYKTTMLQNADYYLRTFGAVIITLSLVGYVLAIKNHIFEKRQGRIFALLAGMTIFCWTIIVNYVALHYALHLAPILITGLGLFMYHCVSSPNKKWRFGAGALVIYLLANMYLSLTPLSWLPDPKWLTKTGMAQIMDQEGSLSSYLFSSNHEPLVRNDIPQMIEFARYLKKEIPTDAAVYVAASSNRINSSVLQTLEDQVFGKSEHTFVSASQIDSRDAVPARSLFTVPYVIVADPPQYHLYPQNQQTITMVVEAFKKKLPITYAFELVPGDHVIEDGVQLTLYRRVRPTTLAELFSFIEYTEEFNFVHKGSARDWIPFNEKIASEPSNLATAKLTLPEVKDGTVQRFVYGSSPPETFVVDGTYEGTADVDFMLVDKDGSEFQRQTVKSGEKAPFSLKFKRETGQFLMLKYDGHKNGSLNDLWIKQAPR